MPANAARLAARPVDKWIALQTYPLIHRPDDYDDCADHTSRQKGDRSTSFDLILWS